MEDGNVKATLGCMVILLVPTTEVVASAAVGAFLGMGFGLLALTAFALLDLAVTASAFRKMG